MARDESQILCCITKTVSATKYSVRYLLFILIIIALLWSLQYSVVFLWPDYFTTFYYYINDPTLSSYFLSNYVHAITSEHQYIDYSHIIENTIGLFLAYLMIVLFGFFYSDKKEWVHNLKLTFSSTLIYLLILPIPISLIALLTLSENAQIFCGFSGILCAILGLSAFFYHKTITVKINYEKSKVVTWIMRDLLLFSLIIMIILQTIYINPQTNFQAHLVGLCLGYLIAWILNTYLNSDRMIVKKYCLVGIGIIAIPTLIWIILMILCGVGIFF
ncbi:MAG: rhomboid family intramembrane serine protease [Bacteroidales bacterium]|nr:rhomboid family intramembrane serine protease [Bacteroidales bacterium]